MKNPITLTLTVLCIWTFTSLAVAPRLPDDQLWEVEPTYSAGQDWNQAQKTSAVNLAWITPNATQAERSKAKRALLSTSFRVMIDPGHGGKDKGAVGFHGLMEKESALRLGHKVKRELERAAKLEGFDLDVRLTRETDVFIPLKERARLANEWGADLYVSLHLNSSPHTRARGFEVYFLSPEASDHETERLALKENASAVMEVKPDVFSILSDVRTNFHMNESSAFAEAMFSAISQRVLSNGRGVRQGPFTVLHGTNMPAVLVEIGYVTNPHEARNLAKDAYLKRLAGAISSGILEYGIRTRKLG